MIACSRRRGVAGAGYRAALPLLWLALAVPWSKEPITSERNLPRPAAPCREDRTVRFDDEVPGTPLQAMRLSRGWSQARLGAELKRVAARRGHRLEVTEHLMSMISRWENGHRRPSSFYVRLLCQVYDVDEAAVTGPVPAAPHPPVSSRTDGSGGGAEPEPWELMQALRGSSADAATLALLETGVRRLDLRFGTLSPEAALPPITAQLRAVISMLAQSQTLSARRRLCSVAGHLAGLRAWAAFDLADHDAASIWYDAAARPARDAGDDALCGWLLGAKSFIASYGGDHRTALRLIGRGQAIAARAAEPTSLAWLTVLEARARAGVGEQRASHLAQERAWRWAAQSGTDGRRHCMDFEGGRISLLYGDGARLVLLQRPEEACAVLNEALGIGGPQRLKHRSTVQLTLATALVQQGEPEAAVGLVREAFAIPMTQLIGPILQRAGDVVRRLQPWCREPFVQDLVEQFAALP